MCHSVTDFYSLILYLSTLLNLLINLHTFWCSVKISLYVSLLSEKKLQYYFFVDGFIVLIFYLAWLLYDFHYYVEYTCEHRHSVAFCILERNSVAFPYSVWCELLQYMRFIISEYVPSVLNLLSWTRLSFIKCLFCSYWYDHNVSVFPSVDLMCHSYWFECVEPSLHTWDWSLSCMLIIHNVGFHLLISESGFLHLCSSKTLVCSFLLLCPCLFWISR